MSVVVYKVSLEWNNFTANIINVINRMANKRAYLKIQNDIGTYDQFAADFGLEPMTFSAVDMAKFIENNKDATEIEIDIRSAGGSVDEAFDIHDQLIASKKKIITNGFQVASAATLIFMAAKKEDRNLAENCSFLPHFPMIGLMGYYNASEVANVLEYITKYQTKIIDFYTKDLGIVDNKERVSEMEAMMEKDIPLTVEETIAWGFATNILEGVVASTKISKRAIAFTKEMVAAHKKNNNNNEDMDKKTEGLFDKLAKMIAPIAKHLGVKAEGEETTDVVATTTALADGTSIYSDGEIAVDSVVYSDEAMTTVMEPNDYELEDKRVITVGTDGIVSAIADAPTASTDAKDTEIAALKKELEDKKAAEAKLKKEVEAIQSTVAEIKKSVSGSNNPNGDEEEEKEKTPVYNVGQIMANISKKTRKQ